MKLLKLDLLSIALVFCMAIFSSYANADGLYLSVGLGVHDAKTAAPEITLGSSLGIVEFGYVKNNWDIKYTHVSGIREKEQGYGINALSVNYRWWIK